MTWQHTTGDLYTGLSADVHSHAMEQLREMMTGHTIYGSATGGPYVLTTIDQVIAWFSEQRFGRLPSTIGGRTQNQSYAWAYWLEATATAKWEDL